MTNVVYLPNYPTTLMLVGPDAATLPHEEDLEAVRATAERAAALGIRTEHLRVQQQAPGARRCSRSSASTGPGCSSSAPTAR